MFESQNLDHPSIVEGPYFDELSVGQVFDTAPGCTLTEGLAAQHQAIVGDRWRLALDRHLAVEVAGSTVVSPSLVWNLAIGQTTLATQKVRANLFYRRLALLRQPAIGDTLRTTTTVVGLRENRRREGREPSGLAALHMVTRDHEDRPVLDFFRCAMLPLRSSAETGHADDLDAIGSHLPPVDLRDLVPDWDLAAFRRTVRGTRSLRPGQVIEVASGDVVSNAPELARLTLNVAAVHHDNQAAGGERLVYGGHTIAIAAAQLVRAIPDIATVLLWESCDHVGPVHEGDTLQTRVTVESVENVGGWIVAALRAEVVSNRKLPVLDWRLSVLLP